ncbi:MAG: radical SAM protein [Candidatus Hydrogenedentota bacterium]|nr:MAG: radical SAM protein [Candidatus Hydrogenedentota bacterium]
MEEPTLVISELYLSIQGESTWAGLPCTFIRLTGCPLRCSYCDTEYAFFGGQRMVLSRILSQVHELGCPLVEVTGGEPLAQRECITLLHALLEQGYTVLLETSGAYSLREVPTEVHRIVDLKCPSSGEMHRNCWENISLLTLRDEVKFVVGTREDYEWAQDQIHQHRLFDRCGAVLFSPVWGQLAPRELASWLLADHLFAARLQIQLHKVIWPTESRGV